MATEPTRRMALKILAGGVLLPAGAHARATKPLYLNAFGDQAGFGIAGVGADGALRYDLRLPGRGHSFACRESAREAVAFTRRPGDHALVFAPQDGRPLHMIAAAEDRSFCGHGTYSVDGRLLFATEAVGSSGDGMLGVYDVANGYRRVAEWPTRGLDPHEVCLTADGRHLVVANGGILMRADMPRLKLNIPEMEPSLVYLDARDGRVVAEVRPPQELRQLSIRHLALDWRGRVAVAMQYEGPKGDSVPLVALHDGPGAGQAGLRYLPLAEAERLALDQYCGSAAIDRSGRFLAVTSPRGGTVLVWDLESEKLVGRGHIDDVCGVAPSDAGNGFMLSNGLGRFYRLRGGPAPEQLESLERRWDNHMAFLHV